MGMMIGGRYSDTRRIQLKDINGNVIATITTRRPKSNSKTKKSNSLNLRRLQYNFKQISNQILRSKTSSSARQVVTKARAKVVELLRKQAGGQFDSRELSAAIIHAKKMERIAKKRMKHLKEEENAGSDGCVFEELEKDDEFSAEEIAAAFEENAELSHEEMQELMEELQELMEELQNELQDEIGLDDLADELMYVSTKNMDEDDLERLKKKHRCDELREIMEADMKYLKALFDKLEKDKQSAACGSFENNNDNSADCGVSLELGGMEMPVETTEAPIMTEGGTVDCSI